ADPESGRQARVVVRAPRVVVACGALESPAVLLRSGIGGPAVGEHLRLHPCVAIFGSYPTDLRAWWGAPHAGLCPEFENVRDGYGFLIEAAQYAPGLAGSAVAWTSGRAHKEVLHRFRYGTSFIPLTRDRGHGRVTVDEAGEAVADPWGQLHDVPGVWIGDGSAFPTASGTNPMVSIMALAHRTAEAIAGATDRADEPVATPAG